MLTFVLEVIVLCTRHAAGLQAVSDAEGFVKIAEGTPLARIITLLAKLAMILGVTTAILSRWHLAFH